MLSALIIDEPWLSMILSGQKSWEMRPNISSKRERIALARKGTKTLVGVATLANCMGPMNDGEIRQNFDKHRVPVENIGKWRYAWMLEDVVRLPRPIAYEHPLGAVQWVNLRESVVEEIERYLL